MSGFGSECKLSVKGASHPRIAYREIYAHSIVLVYNGLVSLVMFPKVFVADPCKLYICSYYIGKPTETKYDSTEVGLHVILSSREFYSFPQIIVCHWCLTSIPQTDNAGI